MDTRARLLQAAVKVFARLGFERATVKDLAGAAQVNVSLVSYHFGGKENLYKACLHEFGASSLMRIETLLTPAQTRQEFGLRIFLWAEEFLRTHVEDELVISILQRELDAGLPYARDVFEKTFFVLCDHWVEFLRKGKRKGFLEPHIDPLILGQLIYGSLIHLSRYDAIHRELKGHSIRDSKVRRRIAEHVVSLVMPESHLGGTMRKNSVKRKSGLKKLMALMGFGLLGAQAHAETLVLSSYLQQVESEHLGIRASAESVQGATLRANEATLASGWNGFVESTFINDGRWQNFQFSPTQVYRNIYRLGVQKQFRFGLNATLGYQLQYENNVLATPAAAAVYRFPTNHYASPFLELRLPLWKGGFGSDVRAQEEATRAQLAATLHAESFGRRVQLGQAEIAYWRLIASREIVRVTQGMVERAESLVRWSERRASLHLAERSDVVGTQSLLQLKKTEFQRASDEMRSAALQFNSMRGRSDDAVVETLEPFDPSRVRALNPPGRAEIREDVLAAREQSRAAEAQIQLMRQRVTPSLDVFFNYSLTGLDAAMGGATSKSFAFDHPASSFGVKFTSSLEIGTVFDVRDGYLRDRAAAEMKYKRKSQEVETEWKDLVAKFAEAKRRSLLIEQTEALQREKVDLERDRLTRGRTVTAQVLQYEQDFMQAQNARVQSLVEILGLYVQLKTFGGQS